MLIKNAGFWFILLQCLYSPLLYAGSASDSAVLRISITIPPQLTGKVVGRKDENGKTFHSLCVGGMGVGNYRVIYGSDSSGLVTDKYSRSHKVDDSGLPNCNMNNKPELLLNNAGTSAGFSKSTNVLISAE